LTTNTKCPSWVFLNRVLPMPLAAKHKIRWKITHLLLNNTNTCFAMQLNNLLFTTVTKYSHYENLVWQLYVQTKKRCVDKHCKPDTQKIKLKKMNYFLTINDFTLFKSLVTLRASILCWHSHINWLIWWWCWPIILAKFHYYVFSIFHHESHNGWLCYFLHGVFGSRTCFLISELRILFFLLNPELFKYL